MRRNDTDKALAGRDLTPRSRSKPGWVARGDRSASPDEDKQFHFAELIDVDDMDGVRSQQRKEVRDLLYELDAADAAATANKDRAEEIKLELERLQKAIGSPGLRHGRLCFRFHMAAGRKQLSVAKLQENGVPKHIIDDSFTKGKPVAYRRLERL